MKGNMPWFKDIRATIKAVFEDELDAFLARCRYDRGNTKPTGYRHGHRAGRLINTFGAETVDSLIRQNVICVVRTRKLMVQKGQKMIRGIISPTTHRE